MGQPVTILAQLLLYLNARLAHTQQQMTIISAPVARTISISLLKFAGFRQFLRTSRPRLTTRAEYVTGNVAKGFDRFVVFGLE